MKQSAKQRRIQQRNLKRATCKNMIWHIIIIIIMMIAALCNMSRPAVSEKVNESYEVKTIKPHVSALITCEPDAQKEEEIYYNSREIGKRVDDEAYYKMLEEMIGDRNIQFIIVDPSAASFIETIKTHGKYIVKGAENDVLDGIRVVTTFLNKGILKIHSSCQNTISEFGLYCWDEDSPDDVVIKENDHAMDEVRYFCYTFLRRRLRWRY